MTGGGNTTSRSERSPPFERSSRVTTTAPNRDIGGGLDDEIERRAIDGEAEEPVVSAVATDVGGMSVTSPVSEQGIAEIAT